MNRAQFFGAMLVIIGLFLLTVFPVFGIVAGKQLVVVSVAGGWAIAIIGALAVVASLVIERINDIKKEKFEKSY